jgi:predicted N-acyltransferase
MDMMSNPGFVRDPDHSAEVFQAMLKYLRKKNLLTIVNDYTENAWLHKNASVLPALPHALIDCTQMTGIDDYTGNFKNIKRKIRVFKTKNGVYERIENRLNDAQIDGLKKCFRITSEKSVFFLPYQELYLKAAITTSQTNLPNVHYFIATLDGEFIGYQAAIVTGKYLNALHGAFDRNRKTTYHAYDILFVKMTEFAIERGLEIIDYGAVINHTKARMINTKKDMSYFIYSKNKITRKGFRAFIKMTRIQGADQMQFRGQD